MYAAILVLAMTLGLTIGGATPARADCDGTRAVLWLHVPKDALEDLLNRELPERREGTEAFENRLLRGGNIRWSIDRAPMALVMRENLVRARTTLTGSVKITGKSPFGTDFSAGPDFSIDAALSLQPRLAADWRLFPNARASAQVIEAKMKVFGFDLNVGGLSQPILDSYLARMVERINAKLADGQFLRKEVERIWTSMHRVDRVSIEQLPGNPPAWFVARPTRIGATNLRLNEEGLAFGVSVFAETDFVIGDEPRQTLEPLPPLEIDDDLPDGSIELALPIFVDWNTANGLIAAHLEKPLVHEGDDSSLEVTAARLSSGAGESVVATVMAKVEPKGWIGWILYYVHRFLSVIGLDTGYLAIYMDHEIGISVRPVVSEDGRRITFRDARLMPQSAHLLKTLAADYYGLTDESLREYVEKHAVVSLDERLDEADTMVREKVDAFTGKLGVRGIDLNLEIRPVTRLASVSARPEGLVARFCAAADIDARILRTGY